MSVGIVFALAAYAAYSFADAIIKGFGQSISAYQIGFITTVFSVIPVLLTKPRDERLGEMFRTGRGLLLHLRAAISVASTVLVIHAFTTIPLAEAYALIFLTPVLVTVLSVLLLGEGMTWRRWALLALGFAGVMLVVRPGFRELQSGHLAAMMCAVCASLAAIILRVVSRSEKRITIVAFSVVYMLAITGVLMIPGFVVPTPRQLFLLALIGLLGGTGHILIITAARNAPANLIAPAQYSQIVWAILLGAIFYEEFPDALAYVGLGVVVLAGMMNVTPERARTWFGAQAALLRRRRGRPPPDAES